VQGAGNVSITATGGDLTVQGSTIAADQTTSINATGNINLLASQNTTQQTNSSSSSSSSVGASFGIGQGTAGPSFNIAASRGNGNGAGTEVTKTNSQISGTRVNINSGGNTTLQGAVVTANTVNADIKGNLTITSLQDTSTFNETSRSQGGSLTLSGGGIPTGGSIISGRTAINSNFASVNEQSGIRTGGTAGPSGSGGFNINVGGTTTLAGGQITSSQAAVDAARNTFNSAGGTTITDIQNTAAYSASGSNTTLGVGSNLSNTRSGVGNASDSASSTTTGGISGIAGNQAARTGDAGTGIAPIFSRDRVAADVQAQIQITGSFGQQAIPMASRYADNQALDLRRQAQTAGVNTPEGQRLSQEAARWDEGGAYRTVMYGGIGALTGGGGGAAGAVAGQTIVPTLGESIAGLNLPEPVRQGLTLLTSVGVGALAGGASGVSAAVPQTAFNYVSHSPFATVRTNVSRENTRLLNQCGSNCTLNDLRNIDLRVQQLEAAGNLSEMSQRGGLSTTQARQFSQLAMELLPVAGSSESLAQLITGRQSLTGEEANRFWAAVGLIPVAGGMVARVGQTSVDVIRAIRAAEQTTVVVRQPGLINDANRLFRQYADDIERQTGYRLTPAQREALAAEMRTADHAVTLNPAQNAALRDQFDSALPNLRREWSQQTGQPWPQVQVIRNGQVVTQNAPAHHVIPVTNNGPTTWWNITPAAQPGHSLIHAPGSPLNQLQTGIRR
jgi:filamentous hemagglutinin